MSTEARESAWFSEPGSSLAAVLFRSVPESLARPGTAAGACGLPGCFSGHGMRRGDGRALLLRVLDAFITREEVVAPMSVPNLSSRF